MSRATSRSGGRRRTPGTSAGGRPPRDPGSRDLRAAILDGTESLLGTRRFDQLSVADILVAAQVSRASFYFYFAGKHEVLADLVRRAVDAGHDAARPWLRRAADDDPEASVRHGIAEGARLWREKAPLLRAIVENWRTDPALAELWTDLMAGYAAASAERIGRDRDTRPVPAGGSDPAALAAALTWLGERLYYLAALGVPPFDDEEVLVDTLTGIWMSTLYRPPPDDAAPAPHRPSTG